MSERQIQVTVTNDPSKACPTQAGRAGIIDVHAHFVPDVYRRALTDGGIESLDGGMAIPPWSTDMALDLMDRHGIGRAILSVSSPGLNIFSADAEPALARGINEAAARIVSDHPDRFGAFATLPMSNAGKSVAEIDHALDVLRLDGFILETNHRGIYPSDPAFAPIFEALNARRAVILLHPTSPACLHCLSGGRPAPLIEFPFDTTRAVVDLIYSGALALYPDIRFILPHAGGTLPFLAQRIAGFAAFPGPWTGQIDPAIVTAQLGRLHYDTALSATPVQMAALRALVPIEQILFGSDWPFSPEVLLGGSLAALRGMTEFDDAERAAILGGNAHALLCHHDS